MSQAIVPRQPNHGGRQVVRAIMAMLAGAGIQLARDEARRVAEEIATSIQQDAQRYRRHMMNWLQRQASDIGTHAVDQIEGFVRRGAEFVTNGVQHIMEGMGELQLENGQDMEQLTLENGRGRRIMRPRRPEHSLDFPVEEIDDDFGMDSHMIETDDNQPEAARAERASGGMGMAPSKETPISIPPTINYGLQETHTTIITATGVGSLFVNKPSTAYPNEWTSTSIRIRLNSPADWISSTVTALPAATVAFDTKVYNTLQPTIYYNAMPVMPGNVYGDAANLGLDESTIWWWTYWKKLYEQWTVIGCEYEVIFKNCVAMDGSDMAIATSLDSYKTGTTGNKTPNFSVGRMMAQKGIKWYSCPSGKLS